MNIADYFLIAALAGIAALAVFIIVRRKKKGSSCCGNCSGCICTCSRRENSSEVR